MKTVIERHIELAKELYRPDLDLLGVPGSIENLVGEHIKEIFEPTLAFSTQIGLIGIHVGLEADVIDALCHYGQTVLVGNPLDLKEIFSKDYQKNLSRSLIIGALPRGVRRFYTDKLYAQTIVRMFHEHIVPDIMHEYT